MTPQQIRALRNIAAGIIESARDAAPAGVIYAALMAHGASMGQFQSIMDTLTRKGFLTHDADAHTYTATPAGTLWAQSI